MPNGRRVAKWFFAETLYTHLSDLHYKEISTLSYFYQKSTFFWLFVFLLQILVHFPPRSHCNWNIFFFFADIATFGIPGLRIQSDSIIVLFQRKFYTYILSTKPQ